MNLLNKIQQELKAPKNRENTSGHYNYRSCEDILEAVKPLLGEGVLILGDDVVNVGKFNYIKATATLSLGSETWTTNAYAREQEAKYNKEGREIMDHAQLTGSASSYARKYALNGLFAIDDTEDPDTMDNTSKTKEEPKKDLGKCPKCGAPMKWSDKYNKNYCSNLCWKKEVK